MFVKKDKQLMNLQKVIREMVKRKGPKMRRTSPEESGVLLGYAAITQGAVQRGIWDFARRHQVRQLIEG